MNSRERIFIILNDMRPEFDFKSSEDFIADGMLDSFDVISMTSVLEETFGIKIDALDIVPENYDSVDHIIALVKKSGGSV